MKRRIFNALAATSLLFCVATVVLWVRSYTTQDCVLLWRGSLAVDSSSARFGIRTGKQDPHLPLIWLADKRLLHYPTAFHDDYDDFLPGPFLASHKVLGFELAKGVDDDFDDAQNPTPFRRTYYAAFVPDQAVMAIFLIPPVIALLGARKKTTKMLEPHCPKCGYDLRATPDRCPECGARVAGQSMA